MQKWQIVAACTAALMTGQNALALRCGTQLVQTGELTIQVRDKCGDPVSEEVIGYTVRGDGAGLRDGREREYKIEQWVYGPDQGFYNVLTFEAGRLRDLDRIRQ